MSGAMPVSGTVTATITGSVAVTTLPIAWTGIGSALITNTLNVTQSGLDFVQSGLVTSDIRNNPQFLAFTVDGGSIVASGGSIVRSELLPNNITKLWITDISVQSVNGSSTDFTFRLYDMASGSGLLTVAPSGLVYEYQQNSGSFIKDHFSQPFAYVDRSASTGSEYLHYEIINDYTTTASSIFNVKINFNVADERSVLSGTNYK